MSKADLELIGPGLEHGEGIREADFQNWKHHPVTKVVLRFFEDYATRTGQDQIERLRECAAAPDLFVLGMFNGRINAYAEMAALEFEHLMNFYPVMEPDEEADES